MRPSVRLKLVVVVVALTAVLLAWWLTPLRTLATPQELQKFMAPLLSSPWLPLYLLLAFVVGGALFLSVWLMILQTALLYPPLTGFPLAMAGVLLSSSLFYGLGRLLGADIVSRLAPQSLQRAVRGAGLQSIIAVRVLPLPFTLVNLCCGAFGVPAPVFVAGTVIVMAPGVLGVCVMGERLLAAVKDPTPSSVALALVALLALVGFSVALRRRARRLDGPTPDAPSDPSPPPA